MIKKISTTLLGLLSLAGVHATEIIGISADDYMDTFTIGEVSSLKFHEQDMISINMTDGNIYSGYKTVVFPKAKPMPAPGFSADVNNIADNNTEDIAIYPNPVEKVLYINGLDEDADIMVISLTGNIVMQTKAQEVDVENLPKGNYILKVNDKMVKFIKK